MGVETLLSPSQSHEIFFSKATKISVILLFKDREIEEGGGRGVHVWERM